jgi:hypothetical protein
VSAEAKFRRAFEAAIRRHVPLHAYMASMTRAGVPDEYFIIDGRSFWLELKAVSKWPVKPDSNILEHRFSGAQLTFMRKVDRAGGRGLGFIGWKDGRVWKCAALRVHDIDDQGTVSLNELNRHPHLVVDEWFHKRFLRLLGRS